MASAVKIGTISTKALKESPNAAPTAKKTVIEIIISTFAPDGRRRERLF
jgi:hypothetical protein